MYLLIVTIFILLGSPYFVLVLCKKCVIFFSFFPPQNSIYWSNFHFVEIGWNSWSSVSIQQARKSSRRLRRVALSCGDRHSRANITEICDGDCLSLVYWPLHPVSLLVTFLYNYFKPIFYSQIYFLNSFSSFPINIYFLNFWHYGHYGWCVH